MVTLPKTNVFRKQLDASLPLKKQLWQQTIQAKINNQASSLALCINEDIKCMRIWANDVRSGDPDNLEARAAAFYWKTLFHDIENFTRDRDGIPPNNLFKLWLCHSPRSYRTLPCNKRIIADIRHSPS